MVQAQKKICLWQALAQCRWGEELCSCLLLLLMKQGAKNKKGAFVILANVTWYKSSKCLSSKVCQEAMAE